MKEPPGLVGDGSTLCNEEQVGRAKKDRSGAVVIQAGSKNKRGNSRKKVPVKKKVAVEKSVSNKGVAVVLNRPVEVDDVMLEFDQYVMYHGMKKKTEEMISSQEKILSQGRSCSSPKGTQRFVNETCCVQVAIESLKEVEQPKDCSLLEIEVQPTKEKKIIEVMIKDANVENLVSSKEQKAEPGYENPDIAELFKDESAKVKENCVVDPMPLSTTNCLDTMSGNDGGQYLSNEKLSSVEVLETSDQEGAAAEEACEPSDDALRIKDSDEDISDNDAKPEEYLFPTPDELEKTSTPELGRVFPTLEEAVRFVNVYAHTTGFGIKKGRNYKDRKITIFCNKSRKSSSTYKGIRKRKRSVVERTNCQMHVTFSLQDGKWHITAQNLTHNHDLVSSPSLTKFFRSHRSMNEAEKLVSRLLQEHRVKPRKIMSIFRKLSGGKLGNITFDVKKLDNLKRDEREKRRNTDIEHTMNYIEKLQIDKPGFIHKAQRDSSNTVLSLFWTDSRSRLDYLLYGDIISFDTTFSTNKYNMPFAPIIGVNGHSRTIVFGWALLQNEKADTFAWLFETFVEVMGGKKT